MTPRFIGFLRRKTVIDAFRLNFSPPPPPPLPTTAATARTTSLSFLVSSRRFIAQLSDRRGRIPSYVVELPRRTKTVHLRALLATMTARQVDDGGVAAPPNSTTTTSGDAGSGSVATVFDAIVKPEADNREYRGLQLANGMKVSQAGTLTCLSLVCLSVSRIFCHHSELEAATMSQQMSTGPLTRQDL